MLPKLRNYRGVCVNDLKSVSPSCVSCRLLNNCTFLFPDDWCLCVFVCVFYVLCVSETYTPSMCKFNTDFLFVCACLLHLSASLYAGFGIGGVKMCPSVLALFFLLFISSSLTPPLSSMLSTRVAL